MLDGLGPFRFMVDTGANHSVISDALRVRLGLSLDNGPPITVSGIAGSRAAATVTLERLDSGALHFRRLRLPVLNGPVFADIDGILGIDGLAGRLLTADFRHDRLAISNAWSGVPIGDIEIPARIVSGKLFEIDALVGGVSAKAIIDTGSQRTIGNAALLQALSSKYRADAISIPTTVVDATATSQDGVLHLVPSLRLGATSMTSFYIAFGHFRVFNTWRLSRQPAIILGMDVLGLFSRITLDYRRNDFGILPRSEMESLRSIESMD